MKCIVNCTTAIVFADVLSDGGAIGMGAGVFIGVVGAVTGALLVCVDRVVVVVGVEHIGRDWFAPLFSSPNHPALLHLHYCLCFCFSIESRCTQLALIVAEARAQQLVEASVAVTERLTQLLHHLWQCGVVLALGERFNDAERVELPIARVARERVGQIVHCRDEILVRLERSQRTSDRAERAAQPLHLRQTEIVLRSAIVDEPIDARSCVAKLRIRVQLKGVDTLQHCIGPRTHIRRAKPNDKTASQKQKMCEQQQPQQCNWIARAQSFLLSLIVVVENCIDINWICECV